MSTPSVYIHTPTYARTRLLAEAAESVVRQTYQGPVTHYILNDCHWQTLEVHHPTAAVVNEQPRIETLGKKRQQMLESTPDDAWIAFLDDDDLWMPDYLEQSLRHADAHDVILSSMVFYHRYNLWTYEEIPGGIPMLVRASVAKNAGFPHDCSYGEDNIFRQRLLGLPGVRVYRNRRPGYCVRAGGTHLHASMADSVRYMLNAEAQRDRGVEPEGVVEVRPEWREDYAKVLRETFPEAFPAGA